MLMKPLLLIFVLAAFAQSEERVGYAYGQNPDVIKCGQVFYYLLKSTHCLSTYYAFSGPNTSKESYDIVEGVVTHKVGSLPGNCNNQTVQSLWDNKRAFRFYNLQEAKNRSIKYFEKDFPDVIQCQGGVLLYRHETSSHFIQYQNPTGPVIWFKRGDFSHYRSGKIDCGKKSLNDFKSEGKAFNTVTQQTPTETPSISVSGQYPDYIFCGNFYMYIHSISDDKSQVSYRGASHGAITEQKFKNGNFVSKLPAHFNTQCTGKSISDLVREKRGFNLNTPLLNCPADIQQDNTLVATFAAKTTADMTLTYSPASGSSFALGKTTPVMTTAINTASNVNLHCTFDVTINDTEPPTFKCPPDLKMKANNELSVEVKATDNSGAEPTVTTTVSATTQSAAGKVTRVTTTATDGSGNKFECVYDTTLKKATGQSGQSLLRTRSQVKRPLV